MEHTITFDLDKCLVNIQTKGDGDARGIITFFKDIVAHPQWKPGLKILLDHRKLKIDTLKMDGIQSISTFFKQIGPKFGDGKLALVMQRDIDFGLARTWEILTADDVDIAIAVFRSIDEASRWLERNTSDSVVWPASP